MAQPSLSNIRIVDPILTRVAYGVRQPQFVGNFLAPPVTVEKRAGKIIRFGDDEFVLYSMRRAPGANITQVMGGWGNDVYELYQNSIAEKLPYEWIEEANELPMSLQERATRRAMRRLLLAREKEQADLMTDLTQYPTTHKLVLAGTNKFSDPDCPVFDLVDTAHSAILDKCGMYANSAIMDLDTFNALKNHPKVIERFVYRGTDGNNGLLVSQDMLAQVLGLTRGIRLGLSRFKLPGDTETTRIWGNYLIMAYVPEGSSETVLPSTDSDLDMPAFAYTYQLENTPFIEEAYYEREVKSWLFPACADERPVLTGLGAGYIFSETV